MTGRVECKAMDVTTLCCLNSFSSWKAVAIYVFGSSTCSLSYAIKSGFLFALFRGIKVVLRGHAPGTLRRRGRKK